MFEFCLDCSLFTLGFSDMKGSGELSLFTYDIYILIMLTHLSFYIPVSIFFDFVGTTPSINLGTLLVYQEVSWDHQVWLSVKFGNLGHTDSELIGSKIK